MFCSKCGTKLIEGAMYCQKCGAKIDNKRAFPVNTAGETTVPEKIRSEGTFIAWSNASAAGADRAQEVFNVTLIKAGPNKGYVIGILRDWLGIRLKEAFKKVKNVPVLLEKKVTREEAEALKTDFMKAGAVLAFTDSKGNPVDIVLRCKFCGAILENGQTICAKCGNAFKVESSGKKESLEEYVRGWNCFNRSEFRKKLFTEIKDACINWIYDVLTAKTKGGLAILCAMFFGFLFITFVVVAYLLSFPILLLIVVAAGYVWYQLKGSKWVTGFYYAALSKVLLLPEGMTPQALVNALNGRFNYPYFKGAKCSINNKCLIKGRYAVYSVKFSKTNRPQLDCDPEESDKKYRTILREAIAIRSYLNRFFAPADWKDAEKDLKALKWAERQRKVAALVSAVTTLIIVIALMLRVVETYIPGGISNLFQPGMEVRNAYLSQYSEKVTVEEAFDHFFENGKWSEYETKRYSYVVFSGVCEYQGERADVEITFKITGENFVVDSLDLNGQTQNKLILYALLASIYEDY